ncbi:hypothetical protein AN1411.2 [Aspergillus nidulans FGSC A4]|uniref:Uncharacterized protein n=1 Tax=Emericella nidulans (strain FGSC A4 / ATCC 38163 / CBS 112.46 / NRRL 194 / M139) TaxID=227321 RepID=Q5BDG9_EMENI|nr:hypothetical protein [Aspergillus nidulans FGSC A4]EAA64541.1 hypothetical protein AN1411.2 [Aspergillus nidulans FGSC A4]CBF84804.1 TPA: conserved hypothetical protein [Aspergillus nidulans FGSC A4]|eukprot:XP_659015.1 hypothetical protein AN1411.2 [Aspergillus nidulans FGSC A4]
MASGDKTPSRLPGPKSGIARSKPMLREQSVTSGDEESQLKDSIKDFDWSQLESVYIQMMEQHEKSEEELRNHITRLLQTTVVHDESRAVKRLVVSFRRFRTQMHHVQNSEESLEKKRRHYMDVVNAFERALALLNDRAKP